MVEKDKEKRVKRVVKLSDFVHQVKGLKIIDDDESLVGSIELNTTGGVIGDVTLHKKI